MIKLYHLIILMCISTSCQFYIVPKTINDNFNICYSEEASGLDKVIDIDGYFSWDVYKKEDLNNDKRDTLLESRAGGILVLFPDGKVAFRNQHYVHIKDVINTWEEDKRELGDLFRWGNYTFSNDTITVQYLIIPKTVHEIWQGFELILTINENGSLTLEKKRGFITNNEYTRYNRGKENIYNYSDFELMKNNTLPELNIPKRFRKLYDC